MKGILTSDSTILNSAHLEENKMRNATEIREYYGTKIAIYFSFLDYYIFSLGLLSILGILVFYDLLINSKDAIFSIYNPLGYFDLMKVDSGYLPFLTLIQSVWGSLFLAFWRKRESLLLRGWKEHILSTSGSTGVQGRSRLVLSYSIAISFVLFCLVCIFLTYTWEESLLKHEELLVYGFSIPFKNSIPLLCRVLIPIVLSPVSSWIFEFCTDIEKHPDPLSKNNSLIWKKFMFQFAANYAALLYIGFIQRDLKVLRSTLIFILTISAVVNNLVEAFGGLLPRIKGYLQRNKIKDLNAMEKMLKEEITLEDSSIDDEFLELAIQFGYYKTLNRCFQLFL